MDEIHYGLILRKRDDFSGKYDVFIEMNIGLVPLSQVISTKIFELIKLVSFEHATKGFSEKVEPKNKKRSSDEQD